MRPISEIVAFLAAVVLRWSNLATGGVIMGMVWLAEVLGYQVPTAVKGWLAIAFLGIAAFLAWREQHRLVAQQLAKRERVLRQCVELIRAGRDSFAALLDARVDDLGSEKDAQYVCAELIKAGHPNPLQIVQAFTRTLREKIEIIPLLRKARLSATPVRNDLELHQFLLSDELFGRKAVK